MYKTLFCVFIFLFLFCACLKTGLNENSKFNDKFFDLLEVLMWVFVIFAFIVFVIDKIQGVII